MAEDAFSRKLWPAFDVRSVLSLKELTEHLRSPGFDTELEPEKSVAFSYACWTIHTGSMSCLTRLIDFMTSDKASTPSTVSETLVGVMRAAVVTNSPSTVRHVLKYAKAKWSDDELLTAAICLSGKCECMMPAAVDDENTMCCACCSWVGCSFPWTKRNPYAPCTVLLSHMLSRTEITNLLVEFAEGLGLTVREQLWPHLREMTPSSDMPGVHLLRAASSGDEEEVRRLLAEGADPSGDRGYDFFGRTPLMHSIYHKKLGMVSDLLQAVADKADVSTIPCTAADMVALAGATDMIDVLCVDGDGKLRNAGKLLKLARVFNNVDFARHIISRCDTMFLQSHFLKAARQIFWAGHTSVEMAELMLPYLADACGLHSVTHICVIGLLVDADRPDLLRVFLSHERFYQVVANANWYDILECRSFSYLYPSVACVRVMLGEGLCINPRDDSLPSPTVLHDAVEVNCTGLVKLYLRAGADTGMLAFPGYPPPATSLTAVQFAQKEGHEECAELIEQYFPSLVHLCLWTVRLNLRKPMSKYVNSLCVPSELKHEIVLP